jgi:copper chaperone CopZ/cytochrome c biogenesis protein CcdA
MQHRIFKVPHIHCQGCQSTINSALADVDGVHEVDPDVATDAVTVAFDEARVDVDRISELLADAGFPVEHVDDAEPADGSGGDAGVSSGRAPAGTRAEPTRDRSGAAARYGVLAAAVLAVALAGYAGYMLYPRFDLPAAEGAGLLGLAAAAGIASFFSPCSFPLLLGLLGRQAVRGADGERTARPVMFGGALALGAATFMVLAGAVIGLGGETLFAGVTFTSTAGIAIRSFVGALLIVLGLAQTGRLSLSLGAVEHLVRPLNRRQAKLRRQHPVAGFGLFGFSYVLAGFG